MNAIIDAHDEACRARVKWSPLNSAHEGYGVLAKEACNEQVGRR